jgi:hypothetical protein
MADRIVPEPPTVDELLKSSGLMRYVLMRLIRARARTARLQATDEQTTAEFARIEKLADDGLSQPLDGRARILYEALETEMARVTGVLGRMDGAHAMI